MYHKPSDSFMSNLYSQLGCCRGQFQSLHLIVLVVFVPWINHLPPVCWSTLGELVVNDSWIVSLTKRKTRFVLFLIIFMHMYIYIYYIYIYIYINLNILQCNFSLLLFTIFLMMACCTDAYMRLSVLVCYRNSYDKFYSTNTPTTPFLPISIFIT